MRRLLTIVAVCAAALLLAGWALGDNCTAPCSNTGVKFVPDIASPDPDVYPVNIPCCNNYIDLKSIFDDISASAGCTAAIVTAFDSTQGTVSWTGPLTANRNLDCGESVWVGALNSACTGWVVVGADCSNSGGPLVAAGYTFIQDDPCIYQFSLPALTTALFLSDVYNDIPNAAAVAHFHPDQSSCSWVGALTCNEPNVTAGSKYSTWDFTTGLRYSVNTDSANTCDPVANVKWIPSTF